MTNVTFRLFAPSGYAPALVARRKDTLVQLGTVTMTETDADGYYFGVIDVGSYAGDVIGSLTNPSGVLAGRINGTSCFLGDSDNAEILDALDTIAAKTALIGTGYNAPSGSMVSPAGKISRPITIGDDYLIANSRSFSWTVDAVPGFSLGDVQVRWGGSITKAGTRYTFEGTGSVDLVDDRWRIRCELLGSATEGKPSGAWDWSVELSVAGVEITKVQNVVEADRVRLIEKQT